MKKYKFAAVMLAVVIIIYIVCNNILQEAGMFLAKYCIQTFARISMPVYGYVRELEKNEKNAAVRFADGVYPINGYARDRYIPKDIYLYDAGNGDSAGSISGSGKENNTANNEADSEESNRDVNVGTADGKNSSEQSDQNTTGSQQNFSNQDNNGINGNLDNGGKTSDGNDKPQTQPPDGENSGELSAVVSNNVITGMLYPKTDLVNYNFVLSSFYTVTGITELGSDKLRPSEFLQKDLRITHNAASPQILIFHTHSQETFADSVEGDTSTSIVGVGDYLTQILRDKYGYNVIHDTSVYDYVNGRLDRSKAYTYAEEAVARILEENPSIEVVIDLHRDGVPETTRLVSDINGKKTAKIMFFNGLSYSRVNGDISYLPNPYRDDNLAMSLQMQLLGNAYYPGFLRRIYVNAYRYCLHMRGRSMLIEAGAQNNTVEEVKNAMEPLADLLDKELRGEKCW